MGTPISLATETFESENKITRHLKLDCTNNLNPSRDVARLVADVKTIRLWFSGARVGADGKPSDLGKELVQYLQSPEGRTVKTIISISAEDDDATSQLNVHGRARNKIGRALKGQTQTFRSVVGVNGKSKHHIHLGHFFFTMDAHVCFKTKIFSKLFLHAHRYFTFSKFSRLNARHTG